jgi:hypothetical protein
MKLKSFLLSFLLTYLKFVSGQNPSYDVYPPSYYSQQSYFYLTYNSNLQSYNNPQSNTYYKYPISYYYQYVPLMEYKPLNNTTIQPYLRQESSAILTNITSFIDIYSIMFVVMIIDIILHG